MSAEKISLVNIALVKEGDAILLRCYGCEEKFVGIVKQTEVVVRRRGSKKDEVVNHAFRVLVDRAPEVFKTLMSPFFRRIEKTAYGEDDKLKSVITFQQVENFQGSLASQYTITIHYPPEPVSKMFLECLERSK